MYLDLDVPGTCQQLIRLWSALKMVVLQTIMCMYVDFMLTTSLLIRIYQTEWTERRSIQQFTATVQQLLSATKKLH